MFSQLKLSYKKCVREFLKKMLAQKLPKLTLIVGFVNLPRKVFLSGSFHDR